MYLWQAISPYFLNSFYFKGIFSPLWGEPLGIDSLVFFSYVELHYSLEAVPRIHCN